MISLLLWPAAMCPGQRAMHGVPQRRLHAGEVRTLPITTGSAVEQGFFVAVVAGEHDDGVLGDAGGAQCVQELAEISVQL